MGYRSSVLIAVAFEDNKHRDEVWAVYTLDPRVQKHNLTGVWKNYDNGKYPVLWYYADYVKWYDDYEDVQGIEHMIEVTSNFAQERGHSYAAINYRIGEELNDIDTLERGAGAHGDMLSFLCDMCGIHRELTHNFG